MSCVDLQVCVVDLAESDWQMLPCQARSIPSDQVHMQRQQSLVRLVQCMPYKIQVVMRKQAVKCDCSMQDRQRLSD